MPPLYAFMHGAIEQLQHICVHQFSHLVCGAVWGQWA